MAVAAKWLRRLEIVLAVAGVSLLGSAFAATFQRWEYQTRQERRLMLPHAAIGEPVPTGPDAVPSVREPGDPLDLTRGDLAAQPLAFGRIEIPRIGVTAIVREGGDDATLALAVGHLPGTARPGERGNAVIAGHRDTFFRGLRHIRLDDRIRLLIPPHSYEYRVVATQVVAPDEVSVLDSTQAEELTLVTCYPFSYIGRAPKRFIVHAARIE